jgi:Xaa-Pro aminopeptidase
MITFSINTYKQRVKQLFSHIKNGIAVFFSNDELPMNYPANTFPFRPNSNFLYFFGLPLPSLIAVVDFDEKKTILFGNDVDIEDIIWMGSQPTMKELTMLAGIDEARPLAQAENFLTEALSKKRTLHFLPPYQLSQQLFLAKLLNVPIQEVKKQASVALIKAMVALRSKKSPEELKEMEIAAEIGYLMHMEAMKRAKEGASEQEIAGIMEGIAWAYGKGPSFPIILSQRGEILHNHDHSLTLQKGKLLLIDAGAQSNSFYASDYTRTVPVDLKFNEQQKAIYKIVLEANEKAKEHTLPGVYYRDVHLLASKIIAERLVELGLLKGNADELVQLGVHALFFPHGLGHMLGLDVHDMEDLGENYVGYDETVERSSQFGLAYLRLAKKLEPGYTLTIEPGIYFIPALIEKWENEKRFTDFINYNEIKKWIGFGGIRLEDNVVVTETGSEFISKRLPIHIEEIENLA